MRTLPLVLAVVLLNDAVLLLALDVAVPAWLAVAGGALTLTALFGVFVTVGVDEAASPSNREVQRQVKALRDRVDALED